MNVSLLYFDDCPNWSTAEARLREAIESMGNGSPTVSLLEVTSPEQAAEVGFRGSPTILIDGHDPFAQESDPTGLACRIYRTESGTEPAPSVAQLKAALVR